MLGQLQDVVDLNEMRNKPLGKQTGKRIVKRDGRGGWVGSVLVRRDVEAPNLL